MSPKTPEPEEGQRRTQEKYTDVVPDAVHGELAMYEDLSSRYYRLPQTTCHQHDPNTGVRRLKVGKSEIDRKYLYVFFWKEERSNTWKS